MCEQSIVRLLAGLVGAATTLIAPHSRAHAGITITDLGDVGQFGDVQAVNRYGQVVGNQQLELGQPARGFLWNPHGGWQYIDTVPGWEVSATTINDQGRILGNHSPPGGNAIQFVWQDKSFIEIKDDVYAARDINNNGVIAARVPGDPFFVPALYDLDSGSVQTLDFYDGDPSTPRALNDHGMVVGAHSYGGYLETYGVVWMDDQVISVPVGDAPSQLTTFVDVNNNGVALGYTGGEPAVRPFLWSADLGVHDVGFAPHTNPANTGPSAINNLDQVVGNYHSPGAPYGELQPYLYANGRLTLLNDLLPDDSPWLLHTAEDINDFGQVVGVGEFNGQRHAYMLQVPAPAAMALLGWAGLCTARSRRRTANVVAGHAPC